MKMTRIQLITVCVMCIIVATLIGAGTLIAYECGIVEAAAIYKQFITAANN